MAVQRHHDVEVARVALDGRAQGVRPDKDGLRTRLFLDQSLRDCHHRVGTGFELREPPGPRSRSAGKRRDCRRDGVERLVEALSRRRLRTPVARQGARRFPHEERGVLDPGERRRTQHRAVDHLPTAVRERDEMTREIPAVHRRHVLWVERTAVFCVVPVVEVAAEALEAGHRRERRLESLDEVERPKPAEIVSGDGRQ